MKIWLFYIGLGVDTIGILIAVYFMISDMLKGTGGTDNSIIFSLTFGVFLATLGAWLLKSAGNIVLANVLLWIPGAPLLFYGLFVLLFLIFPVDMK